MKWSSLVQNEQILAVCILNLTLYLPHEFKNDSAATINTGVQSSQAGWTFPTFAKEEHREVPLSIFSKEGCSSFFPHQILADSKGELLIKSLSGNCQLVFNHDIW